MLNAAAALAAWALAGPCWGVVVFLTGAIARVTLEAQGLRNENATLRRVIAEQERRVPGDVDEPPVSGTRPGRAGGRDPFVSGV